MSLIEYCSCALEQTAARPGPRNLGQIELIDSKQNQPRRLNALARSSNSETSHKRTGIVLLLSTMAKTQQLGQAATAVNGVIAEIPDPDHVLAKREHSRDAAQPCRPTGNPIDPKTNRVSFMAEDVKHPPQTPQSRQRSSKCPWMEDARQACLLHFTEGRRDSPIISSIMIEQREKALRCMSLGSRC